MAWTFRGVRCLAGWRDSAEDIIFVEQDENGATTDHSHSQAASTYVIPCTRRSSSSCLRYAVPPLTCAAANNDTAAVSLPVHDLHNNAAHATTIHTLSDQ